MKIRNIILAAVIALASLSFSIGVLAQNNRYGMRLKEKDGELFVSNSRAYRKLGIDVAKLPDVLVPFKPKITAYDRKSVRSVVPDTLVYKTNSAGDDLRLLCIGHQENALWFSIYMGWLEAVATRAIPLFARLLPANTV